MSIVAKCKFHGIPMGTQPPDIQQDAIQHGGSFCPTVLYGISLTFRMLHVHIFIFKNARIMVALNQAERDGIIIKNPGKDIDRKLKPHSEQKVRCYLTIEEVRQIIECEYRPDNDVKSAFLFCCFSGLRFSDVKKMTWGEITVTNDGQAQLETKMKKTGKSIWVPLSDNVIKWLPERGEALDTDLVFAKLPEQSSNVDSMLKTLIKKAGITKNVTFHTSRYSISFFSLKTNDLQNLNLRQVTI